MASRYVPGSPERAAEAARAYGAGVAEDAVSEVEGVVTFFTGDRGRGAVTVPVPGLGLGTDVWVHCSVLEMEGFRAFEAGDVVPLEVEQVQQDSFRYRATRARLLRHGPAPVLRRRGDRVEVAPAGTPDTPLRPRRTDRRAR